MQKPRNFIRRPAPHETLRIADLWIELKSAIASLLGQPDAELKRALDRLGVLLCEKCSAYNPSIRPQFEEETLSFDDAVRSAMPIPRRRGSVAQSTVSRARTLDVYAPRAVNNRNEPSRIIVPQVIRKAVVPKMTPALPRQSAAPHKAAAHSPEPRAQRTRPRVAEGARGTAPRQKSVDVPEFSPLPGTHRPWPSAMTPAFPSRLVSMPAVQERHAIRTSAQAELADPPLRVCGEKIFFVFDGLKDDADLEGCEAETPTQETSRALSRPLPQIGDDEEDEDAWLVPQEKPPGSVPGRIRQEAPRPEPARVPPKVPLAIRTASRVVQPDESPRELSPAKSSPERSSSKNTDSALKYNKKRGWDDLQTADKINHRTESSTSSSKGPPPEPATSKGVAQGPPASPPSPTPVSVHDSPEAGPHKKKKSSKKRKASGGESKGKKKKRKKTAESIYVATLCSPNRVPKRLAEALSAAEEANEVIVQTESDLYEVEAIREMMIDRYEKREYFLVKWENYAEVDNTWEPSENLEEFGHHKERMDFLRRIYHAKVMVSQTIARNAEYKMTFSVDEDLEYVRVMRSFNEQERTRRLDGSELFYVTASSWSKPTCL